MLHRATRILKGHRYRHCRFQSHVLLIDDTQAILDVMRELLEDEGYRVSISIETLELGRIKALKPDVIVQDLLFAGTRRPAGIS